MKLIVCEDCKKRYDFDKDEFCPKCGAFNQPVKTWGTDDQGNVIRVDGVNEANHAQSFVHKEVHREKAVRRITGLDRGATGKKPAQRPPQDRREPGKKGTSQLLLTLLIIGALIVIGNFILPLLVYLFA